MVGKGVVVVLAGAIAMATPGISEARSLRSGGCVTTFGPATNWEAGDCSYVANGPGQYFGIVNAGGFEIYVDGRLVVASWRGAEPVGAFAAAPGQEVTVFTECDRGVYCAWYAAVGLVEAGDR